MSTVAFVSRRNLRHASTVACACALLAGCGSAPVTAAPGGSPPPAGAAPASACPLLVEFEGVRYEAWGHQVSPLPGESLGIAATVPCSDEPGVAPGPASELEVLAVEGVAPSDAIMTRAIGGPDGLLLVAEHINETNVPPGLALLLEAQVDG